jgi:5-formyltetrahydrofolate cyclo-ligase
MKKHVRKIYLQKRIQQSILLKQNKDAKIIKKIEETTDFINATHILFYMPIHGEVDITPLFIKYNNKKKLYLPRVNSKEKDLDIHEIKNLDQLKEGVYKILEPQIQNNLIEPASLDLVLIPGIAFDTKGQRIGYGHGYFDKFLKKTNCPKFGIAYEFQIVKNIAAEKHDVPVDKIVTERRIIDTEYNRKPLP